ncbi:ATP-binding protein [Sagittula sp. S175]|uniref:ATP-binding protein n=1 Tax=Sagittula sp. S175 TaxID=3415129 RepID=UPI003C7DAD2E
MPQIPPRILTVCRLALLLAACLLWPVAGRAQRAEAEAVIVPFGPVPPFMYRDTAGARSGFFIALAEAIAREIGRPIDYLDLPDVASVVAAQNAGRSHMMAGIVKLPTLLDNHVYSDPVASDLLRFAVLVDTIRDFESGSVEGYRIGIVPPILGSDDPVLQANTPVPFANVEAALFGLLKREVDALLIPPPTVFRLARDAGVDGRIIFGRETVGEIPRYVMLHRARADLLPEVNAAIARLEASGALSDLRQRYSLEVPPPEPDVLDVPIAHAPPYGIISDSGEVSGYAAELFDDLAQRAGLQVRFHPVSLDTYFGTVTSHAYDAVPFLLRSEEIGPDLDLTIPIDSAAFDILVRRDDDRFDGWTDLDTARVGALPDAVSAARQHGFRAGELRVFDTLPALADALSGGEIDALMEVGHTLDGAGMRRQFKSIGAPDFTVDNVIGLRPGLGAVRERLNAVIPGYLLSDDYVALRQRYFTQPVFWSVTRLYTLLGLALAALLLLAGHHLRDRQRQRRAAFEQQHQDLLREQAHARQLQTLVSQLQQANREQAEFTYAISHDLKSPANTIGMLIDVLSEEADLDGDGRDVLADMARTNSHMRQLVDDVLAYSRIVDEALVVERVALAELVQTICADLRGDIVAADARIEIGDLPDVTGNPTQLRMLFQNLIANAIKFRNTDRRPLISVTGRRDATGLVVEVSDNGIGIPAQHRDKVFGLFQRLHSQTRFAGTGLGLTICKRVMSNHKGDIRIADDSRQGTTFIMTFPEEAA